MRYFLKLAYNGVPYHGWQRQPNAISVQQTLEEALATITRRSISITGAGRTDTGVHAKEMYAHFDHDEILDSKKFLTSLNRLIGNNIAVNELLKVREDAHARFDAISRSYSYYVILGEDPFWFQFSHRMYTLPDIDAMNEAAEILLNTSDFTSFAKLHSDAKTNICKVSEAKWTLDSECKVLTFNIKADRFLRNMVRAVVGTLIEVGTGKMNLKAFEDVILRKDRCAAGMSMPAKGLFLTKVEYPEEIFIP